MIIFGGDLDVNIDSHEPPNRGASKTADRGILGRYKRRVIKMPTLMATLARLLCTAKSCRYKKKIATLEVKKTGAKSVV